MCWTKPVYAFLCVIFSVLLFRIVPVIMRLTVANSVSYSGTRLILLHPYPQLHIFDHVYIIDAPWQAAGDNYNKTCYLTTAEKLFYVEGAFVTFVSKAPPNAVRVRLMMSRAPCKNVVNTIIE